jgi:phosphate transport system permease protein
MHDITNQPRNIPLPGAGPSPANNGQGQLRLEKSLRSPRTLFNFTMTALTALATFIALVPLVSVLCTLLYKGLPQLTWRVFVSLPPAPGFAGGGFGNAIVGTALMVGIAVLISVPLGVLAALYLSEFAGESKGAEVIRFSAKVLTGMPSILAGVFAYALVVVALRGGFSPVAGGVALAVLMLPIVLLTAEEAFKQVPAKMRDAAFGMGATPTQVVWRIVVPTALPGMLTGVMLAVARAAGETAPLLFTALFSDYWISHNLNQPTASLAVLIYGFSNVPYENQVDMAWTASLVLVIIVLTLNLVGQRLIKSSHQQR